jgi:hypothetical protein
MRRVREGKMLKVNHLTSEFDRVKSQTRPQVIIIGDPERSNIKQQEERGDADFESGLADRSWIR